MEKRPSDNERLVVMDSGPGADAPSRNDGTGDPDPDPAALDAPRAHRWRRKPKMPETRAARRERLDRAAGEAITRAAETNGDPVALMAAASGTEARYCDPIIRQHDLFFGPLRARFLMPEERQRLEREAQIAAVVAAEPGPVVWVRRQFNGKRRRAAYRLADVSGLHWSSRSGGKKRRANRPYLHGYVWCDAMIVGAVAHSCRHGPPPHRIKVCLTRIDNKTIWREIERAALGADAKRDFETGRSRRTIAQSVSERTRSNTPMANASTLSLPEIEDRIAILRDNIRQLTEQAAALSGAADEARAADRIAAQQAELDRLVAQRDAMLAKRAAAARPTASKKVAKKKAVKNVKKKTAKRKTAVSKTFASRAKTSKKKKRK